MARAIIKNPVGNVGDVREDVKIAMTSAEQQGVEQFFFITLSKKNVNYSAKFYFEGGEFLVENVEGGDEIEELENLLKGIENVKAIVNMLNTFYNLRLISEYELMFQMKDLEELVEAYLNGAIVPGQADALGYWKTLFYKKDENHYVIGDELSGNTITISIKEGEDNDEVRFGVAGAEVQNLGFDLISLDVLDGVFSQATENRGTCYLPLTRYEELLEYLGTRLSEFENDSRFVEKEYNKLRRTDAHYESDSEGMLRTAKYNNIKYSARLNEQEEIAVSYEEGGNDMIAGLFQEILENDDLGDCMYYFISSTYDGINAMIDNGYDDEFNEKQADEIFEYVLNNGVEASAKLYIDGGLRSLGIDENGDPMYSYMSCYKSDGESRGEINRFVYQRLADRYGIEDYDESIFPFEMVGLIDRMGFIPFRLYDKIVSLDYDVIPATGVLVDLPNGDSVEVGGSDLQIYRNVAPTDSGDVYGMTYATNPAFYWITDESNIISITNDGIDNNYDTITGTGNGTVNLSCVSLDGGFSETVQITSTWTHDITITAGNGGTVSTASFTDVDHGTSVSVSGNVLTVGENTCTATASQDTAQYTYAFQKRTYTQNGHTYDLTSPMNLTSDITIQAVFTATTRSYTISISASNGSVDENSLSMNYGTTITAVDDELRVGMESIFCTPSSGYEFQKRTYTIDGQTYDLSGSITLTGNVSIQGVCVQSTPSFTLQDTCYLRDMGTVDSLGNPVRTLTLFADDPNATDRIDILCGNGNSPMTVVSCYGVFADSKFTINYTNAQTEQQETGNVYVAMFDENDPLGLRIVMDTVNYACGRNATMGAGTIDSDVFVEFEGLYENPSQESAQSVGDVIQNLGAPRFSNGAL